MMKREMSVFKKEDAVGKTVVAPDGKKFGVVKDLGFRTDGTVVLIVSREDGREESVQLQEISGIADYVVLKPAQSSPPPRDSSTPTAVSPSVCPKCQNPLRPGAKFCPRCGTKVS